MSLPSAAAGLPEPAQLPQHSDAVERLIDNALLSDRFALRRLLKQIVQRSAKQQPYNRDAQRLLTQLQRSLSIAAQRQQSFQSISFPSSLPVVEHREKIRAAIAEYQVVIVAGETGSGKTTQLPKICAELGRGVYGRIGHTQPRRIAARSVAARIAEELEVSLGAEVGYHFRFNDLFDDTTRIKVMTDGILLAAIAHDRYLNEFDTLIIDEAHERSLNIDFLLGFIKTLLPKRPDLKVIITSATIDVQRFAEHFEGAPIVEIEGRSFPVSIVYPDDDAVEPPLQSESGADTDEADISDINYRVGDALKQIEANDEVGRSGGPRDVLVFLPGEREIRDLSQFLKSQSHLEVLPLYARLSQKEQQRIFSPSRNSGARRRVVLATNVAETSVTVPGIGYVIDSGVARISRYSARSKLQRLPLEAISQASANQRAGRCGRLAPGVCYRLYSEDDFKLRPAFTEPELLRTHLASVVLQMKALDLGDIERFPFMEKPDARQVRSGLKTLQELGALNAKGGLSQTGAALARLPIDPRLARMLLAGREQACLPELLVIVSALAVQDPREYPAEKRQAADQSHRRFWHPQSDFLTWLNLWCHYERQRESLSQNQLRRWCKKCFLSYPRMREWRDLHRQLLLALKPLLKNSALNPVIMRQRLEADDGKAPAEGATGEFCLAFSSADYASIHTALLTGLPANIGLKEARKRTSGQAAKEAKGQYRGARNLQFSLFPGSSQFKKMPQWVAAAEIVQTRKVYARTVAAIEAQWMLKAVPHLVKHSYSEPHWDIKRGQVMAWRSSTLYGLNLVGREKVAYENIDAEATRNIFIQQALAVGELGASDKLKKRATFWQHNCALIEEITLLEEKVRRRDLLVDEVALANFYQQHLPVDIVSRRSLEQWLVREPDAQQALFLSRDDVLLNSEADNTVQQFPDTLALPDHSFALRYSFMPGADNDGVTALIPLGAMGALPIYAFDWLVPGMLRDKCIEMVKALPKAQRKQLVPVPSVVDKLLSRIDAASCQAQNKPLAQALAEQIAIFHSLSIDALAWRAHCETVLDSFYRMRFEIYDTDIPPEKFNRQTTKARCIDNGRQLQDLIEKTREQLSASVDEYADASFRRDSITRWDFGPLVESHEYRQQGMTLRGYPALLDNQDSVSLDLLASPAEAQMASRHGVLRLAMLAMKDKVRFMKKNLCKDSLGLLPYVQLGNREQLLEDLIKAAVAASCFNDFEQGLPRDKDDFDRCIDQGRAEVIAIANEVEALLYALLKNYQQNCEQLQQRRVHFKVQCDDMEAQQARLLAPGFLLTTGYQQLRELPRYLKAIGIRLDRLSGSHAKDLELCEKLSSVEQPLATLLYKYPEALFLDPAVRNFRWLIEELRVSLFAQQLKTAIPVSLQRAVKEWNTINHNQYPALNKTP